MNLRFQLLDAIGLGLEPSQPPALVLEPSDQRVDEGVQPAQLRRLHAPRVENGPELVGKR